MNASNLGEANGDSRYFPRRVTTLLLVYPPLAVFALRSLETLAQTITLKAGYYERHPGPEDRDVLCSWGQMFLFWCLPSFAFALGFLISPALKTVLWTLSLAFMGTGCLLNASRCGRIHCYFTGPLLIVVAVTSLGYGIGLLPLGPSGWKWIGDITIIGAILLTCVPELFLGHYRRRKQGLPNQSMKPPTPDGK